MKIFTMPKKKNIQKKPIIKDKPCDACGEMIDMNGDGWVVNLKGQTLHYGAFTPQKDKCFKKIIEINARTKENKTFEY